MSVQVEQLDPERKRQFGEIWLPWLTETMGLTAQAEDLEAMADPIAYYGATGGAAFIATLDGMPVGTIAVKGLGGAGFEFCKLVVNDTARGHGAGKALITACIAYAKAKDGPYLWLQSFKKLDVALGIYERMGFAHSRPPPEMAVLNRTEVIMKLPVL